MTCLVDASLGAAAVLTLALEVASVGAPLFHPHSSAAPTIAARPLTWKHDPISPRREPVAEPSSGPMKQATPKDPRVWAPLIHQTYPREAALAGLEGSVRIKVAVDETGRVSDCFVVQSSGHAILDQAACDGMRRFAVFNPATDASGSPTVGSYATIITYRLRTPQPQRREPIPLDRSASTT